MNSLNKVARIIGILLLVLVVIAPFSMLYVPSTLIVADDAAATASNVAASQGLLRMAVASDSLVFLIEIFLTVLIFVLLKPVNETLSLTAAFARLSMTIVQGFNVLNYLFVLLLVSGDSFVSGFGAGQLQSMVLLFLKAHEAVALIWGLFFALHLLLIGYLVFKSGYIAKFVGVLLLVASLCYFVQSFGSILVPQYEGLYATIGLVSMVELAFPLWLLIKGVKINQ